MGRVAAVGDYDSVIAFAGIGIDTYPVSSAREASEIVRSLASQEYMLVFLAESLGEGALEIAASYAERTFPVITLIPGAHGSHGAAVEKLRRVVERAVGADILVEKEDS